MATLQSSTIANDVIVAGARQIQGQGFQGYYAFWQNNIAYTVDFTAKLGSVGHVWWVSASYQHSGTSYGAGSEQWYTRYNGVHSALYDLHNYSSSLGGSIGWTSPNTTQIRCTKNAGYYPGQGGAIVQVNGPL